MHLGAGYRGRGRVLVVLVAGFAVASSGRADWLHAGATDRVALDIPADTVVTVLAGTSAVAATAFSKQLAPAQCRWCDGPVGTAPNAVDGFFHDALTGAIVSRKTADRLSLWASLAPIAAVAAAAIWAGPHATSHAWVRTLAIVTEGAAVSEAITHSIKLLPARERPFAHYGHPGMPDEGRTYDVSDVDSHLSFPSGHTTTAAALGVGAAMTASLQDSAAAPWLWGAAGVLTVSTATLRMIAEKHYFTDVLAGAAIGVGCGIGIPLLHRRGALLADGSSPAGRTVATGRKEIIFTISGSY